MKIFGYLRVSGKGQVEGDGFPRQEEAVHAFCASHGLTLDRIFREEGVSGTVDGMDRPAFSEMIAQMDDAPGVVIVERLDRLARDLMVSEVLLGECRRRGILVYPSDQGQLVDVASDGNDPTRVLIRQIMAALSQWEKSNLVMKLRIARDRVRARTGRCEGRKKMEMTPAGKILRDTILNLNAAGWNYQKICDELNDCGFRNRRGDKWQKSNLQKLIIAYRKTL